MLFREINFTFKFTFTNVHSHMTNESNIYSRYFLCLASCNILQVLMIVANCCKKALFVQHNKSYLVSTHTRHLCKWDRYNHKMFLIVANINKFISLTIHSFYISMQKRDKIKKKKAHYTIATVLCFSRQKKRDFRRFEDSFFHC